MSKPMSLKELASSLSKLHSHSEQAGEILLQIEADVSKMIQGQEGEGESQKLPSMESLATAREVLKNPANTLERTIALALDKHLAEKVKELDEIQVRLWESERKLSDLDLDRRRLIGAIQFCGPMRRCKKSYARMRDET